MSQQTTALESNIDKPSLVSTPDSSEKDRWRHICITECIRISEHLERLRQSWGADHLPVIIIQPATIAAFALLEDLHDRPESSRRFRVCKGVLRLLEKTSKENGIVVPDGCGEFVADFNHANAIELDDMATKINDLGSDYLLKKWDDLDFELNRSIFTATISITENTARDAG